MKKDKTWLISAIAFTTYDIYVLVRTIYYLINKDTYGNVYFEFMFYPHFIFMIIGTTLNYILYFKNNKYIKYIMILSYIIAIIFLFINK
ncbi:MAG: hypothetical protein IJ572_03775 [Bacilli bacterium]|nr:hypothetical protein [Bacilli bacterium]